MSAGFDRDRLSRNFAVFSSIQYLTEGCGSRVRSSAYAPSSVIVLPVLIKWIAENLSEKW